MFERIEKLFDIMGTHFFLSLYIFNTFIFMIRITSAKALHFLWKTSAKAFCSQPALGTLSKKTIVLPRMALVYTTDVAFHLRELVKYDERKHCQHLSSMRKNWSDHLLICI